MCHILGDGCILILLYLLFYLGYSVGAKFYTIALRFWKYDILVSDNHEIKFDDIR